MTWKYNTGVLIECKM